MPKYKGNPKPQKFISYNYRIEREQWAEELFYRDLEFENPGLASIPYYNAMRTSARERFDPAERLPRIDIASVMRFRGARELIIQKPMRVHDQHTGISYMSYLVDSPKAILDRTMLSKPGNGWRMFPEGVYRYNKTTENPEILNLEIISKKMGHFFRNKCNRIILRYSPLIVADFTDPDGPYRISDKVSGEEFSAAVIPLLEYGAEQAPPPVPVSARGHFSVTMNKRKNQKGKWISLSIPLENDASREYRKMAMMENAREKLMEAAYDQLSEQNRYKTVLLADVQMISNIYRVPLNALLNYLNKKKVPEAIGEPAKEPENNESVPKNAIPELKTMKAEKKRYGKYLLPFMRKRGE